MRNRWSAGLVNPSELRWLRAGMADMDAMLEGCTCTDLKHLFGVRRDALSRKDSFATLRDFWHSGTRPSLRRAGGRCRVAAICQADLF